MSRQKKLDDGLNRLFSTTKKGKQKEPPSPTSDMVSEPKDTEKDTGEDAIATQSNSEEVAAPPPSHLIPVPETPTLPLQLPDVDEDDLKGIEAALEKEKENQENSGHQKNEEAETKKETKQILYPDDEHTDTPTEKQAINLEDQSPPSDKKPSKSTSFSDEQIVIFSLAGQQFGVNITVVDGIIKMQPITVVPGAPHYIEGVTNLRGNVVPVINLHKRLGVQEQELTNNNRIIIINSHDIIAGMLVDEVSSVTNVMGKDLETVARTISSIDTAFIRAVAKIEGSLVIMLELEKVLQHRSSSID